MKIKKGLKIFGATLGAVAVTMSVVCCYAPSPDIHPESDLGYHNSIIDPSSDVNKIDISKNEIK